MPYKNLRFVSLSDLPWKTPGAGFVTPTPRCYHLDQDAFLAFEGQASVVLWSNIPQAIMGGIFIEGVVLCYTLTRHFATLFAKSSSWSSSWSFSSLLRAPITPLSTLNQALIINAWLRVDKGVIKIPKWERSGQNASLPMLSVHSKKGTVL